MARPKNDESTAKVASDSNVEYDYVVVQRFRDVNSSVDDPKYYEVGDSVNRFGEERLNDVVSRRLVEKREVK